MKASVVRQCWRRTLAGGVVVLTFGPSWGAPVSQDDPVAGADAGATVPALVEPSENDRPGLPAAGGSAPERHRRSLAERAAADEVLPAEAAASAATLPRHASSVALVDEDPQVEIVDVIDSVARATVAAVPWLRLGSGKYDEAQRRREAAHPEPEVDTGHGADTGVRAGTAGGTDGGPGSGPALHVNLIDEAIEIARDFVANPLTWIFGVPVVLAAFMVSVLRGRRK